MTDPIATLRDAEGRLFAAHGLSPTERFLELRAPAMRARVWDCGGTGPVTLHVHGGGAFGALMAPLAAALPGRRHLLLDRPGFGLSDHVPIRTPLRRHAVDFLAAVLDALKLDAVDVVANSMGGLWSLSLALELPRRVSSLALLGMPALVGGTSAPMPMRLLGRPVIGRLMMALEPPSPKQVRVLWHRMGHDPDKLHPTVLDAMLAAERVPTYPIAWRDLLRAALTLSGPARGAAFGDDELARITCPVAFALGAADPFGDVATGEAIARHTPGARFTVVGTGHLPWLDDAEGCARAVLPVLAPLVSAAA